MSGLIRKFQLGRRFPALLSCALFCGLFGCGGKDFPLGDAHEPATHARPRLWTLVDLVDARTRGEAVASTPELPDGLSSLDLVDEPSPGAFVPRVLPAFSEGAPAAYLVTDVWTGYDAVWVQPWYYLVTAWNERSPQQNRLKAADGKTSTPPLFDVGPRSGFYSPFWQIRYVEVPPKTAPDAYTSTRQLVNDRLPIHAAGAWTYTVRTPSLTLGASGKLTHPYLGTEIGNASLGDAAWLDGDSVPYLSLGGANFRFDEHLVVEEVPLFLLARTGPDGRLVRLDAPAVVGSATLGSGRAADVVDGRPRFGAYTRVHVAIVPATAAPFDPAAHAAAVAILTAKGTDPNAFRGRVAVNATAASPMAVGCFDAPEFPTGCQWLDSQAAVEQRLGATNLVRTSVTLASPLVFFGGKGIGK